ncbi:hypothetical protein D557_1569 [Bordetella holmesii 70147]|nr:hypothetical protein D557_1569 [Bordetella holmesii 70147]
MPALSRGRARRLEIRPKEPAKQFVGVAATACATRAARATACGNGCCGANVDDGRLGFFNDGGEIWQHSTGNRGLRVSNQRGLRQRQRRPIIRAAKRRRTYRVDESFFFM